MALPTLETPENKGQVQEIISDIATAVFKSAKISMESAAKAVVPSVPEMVNEVLDDLKSGSIQKFNQAMEKLDKLVKVLGIDLKKYNKELANFAEKREQKIIQSEEKIQTLREKNIVAQIEKSGDITILSQKEIEDKQKDLRDTEKKISDLKKKIAKDTKQIQDPGLFQKELKTTAQFNKKEEIKKDVKELEQKKKERDQAKGVLGKRGEQQPGILQRGREGVGNFVEEYVPQPIADVGNAMVEGFMAPINAVKELGRSFGQLLKPLKMLKPLFTGLLASLKKFALGLKASVVAMLPQIVIAGLIVLALGGLYLMLKKAQKFFGKDDKTGLEDYGEDIGGPTPTAEYGDFGSRMQRKGFFADTGGDKKEFIKPDDPRYDEIYEKTYNKPAPEKGQVYMGDGKVSILPIDSEGKMNPMELRKMEAEGFKLKPNPLLNPIDKKETGG